MRKILTMLLAVSMLLGTVSGISVFAADDPEPVLPEVLVYRNYNDQVIDRILNTAAGDTDAYKYGTISWAPSGKYHGKSTFKSYNGDGNYGIVIDTTSITYTSTNKQTTVDKASLTTGKLYIGFDTAIKALDADDFNADSTLRIEVNSPSSGKQAGVIFNLIGKYTDSEGVEHSGGILKACSRTVSKSADDYYLMTPETPYRCEFVYDLDNKIVYRYVNGEDIGSTSGGTIGASFSRIGMVVEANHGMDYLDNFTMVHYPTGCDFDYSYDTVYTPGTDELALESNEIVLKFREAPIGFDNGDFELVNQIDGSEVSVKSIERLDTSAELTNETLSDYNMPVYQAIYKLTADAAVQPGEPYELVLSDGLTGVMGNTLTEGNMEIRFPKVSEDELYIKDITLTDLAGDEYKLNGTEIPTELDTVTIAFSGAVDAEDIKKYITISDEDGVNTITFTDVEVDGSNVATINVGSYLAGKSKYKLLIADGLNCGVRSSFSFTTLEGRCFVQSVGYTRYNSETKEYEAVDTLEADKDYYLAVNVINTTGDAQSMYMTYSLWDEITMKKFGAEKISIGKTDVEKTYYSKAVNSKAYTALKGFVINDLADDKVNPLIENTVLK